MSRISSTLRALSVLTLSAVALPAVAEDPLDWSGFYVGAQLGLSQSNGTIDPFLPVPDSYINEEVSLGQGVGGVYAGYNLQDGALVWGIEGDVSARIGEGADGFTGQLSTPSGWRTTSDWEVTLRGRLGFSAAESALLFGTAGIAISDFNLDNPGCEGCAAWGTSDILGGTRTGAVLGGGVEYAANEDVHIKLEYLHTFYGTETVDIGPPGYDAEISQDAVRAGVSFALN